MHQKNIFRDSRRRSGAKSAFKDSIAAYPFFMISTIERGAGPPCSPRAILASSIGSRRARLPREKSPPMPAPMRGRCAACSTRWWRLGILSRKTEKYSLTPPVATYLVKSSELYMDGAVAIARQNVEWWSHLGETVKGGRFGPPPSQDEMTQFFSTLVRAIFPLGFMGSKSAVAALDKKARGRITAILDLAAGAAAWSIPFAQAIPKARVTVADFPGVTDVAREYTTRFGVADRYDYLDGNLRETDFGSRAVRPRDPRAHYHTARGVSMAGN